MQKSYRNLVIMISALALTLIYVHANAAPQQGKQKQDEHAAKQEAAADFNNYRVKYTVDEVENGKTINSRAYTMILKAGGRASIRIGGMAPYSTEQGIKHWDVSMKIDCSASRQQGNLVLHTAIAMSTLFRSSLETRAGASPAPRPVIFGNFRLDNFAVANLGRPTLVGSADDIASNRQYVVGVTVTKAN